MKSVTDNPLQPGDEGLDTPDFSALEGALRDACTRAMYAIFPLAVMLKLYRSVTSLTRALMLARVDAGLPKGLSPELAGLLDAVRDAACGGLPDPELPVMDAILVHRAIVALAGAAHRARGGRRVVSATTTPEPSCSGLTRSSPATEAPEAHAAGSNPPNAGGSRVRPEHDGDDDAFRLSAWRKDHTTERDRRAHELLHTVLEERIFKPARVEGQRLRAEREARERAEAEQNSGDTPASLAV